MDSSSNKLTALHVVAIAVGMFSLAYASVPLYRLFCQVTGFGGTTQARPEPSHHTINREVTVRFDGNVERNFPWKFHPVQQSIHLKIGENAMALYEATNLSDKPITGTASFNVVPAIAGQYFVKVQCFCFTEQTLQPGQTVQMPVSFYVDPQLNDDKNLKNLKTITLSYTFFKVKEPVK